ncbi:MAG: hypothetical protein IJX27_03760 [Clostridia bacterium]|nr:hypothetical protein [Clostridia bacterium]
MSEKGKSHLTLFAMIASTLFSKALGLCRSMLLAWTLGDLPEAAAFAAASKIPGAVFDLLFSAAIAGTFIPLYGEARQKGVQCARSFARAFFGACLAAASALALAGALFAPQVMAITAPSLGAETARLSARLLRIMFPSTVFAAGVYTLSGLMQSHGGFILPAAVSAFSNLFIIAYLLFSGARFSVYGLSLAYVFSWGLQFFSLALPLILKGRFPLPQLGFRTPLLRKAVLRAPRVMACSWLAPASALAAAFFCSFVSDAALVLYDYASGIYTIAAGVAVYGVGNYVFPALAALYAEGNLPLFAKEVQKAVFSALTVAFPVFCAVAVLAGDAVSLLYAHGNFSADAAHACARALLALSPAIPAFAVSEILYRAFCAAGKTKAPVSASLTALAVLFPSGALFLAAHGGLTGICAALAASQWAHALFLIFAAKKHFGVNALAKTPFLVLCSALCFAVMSLLAQNLPFFSQVAPSISIFLKITIVFTIGIVVYLYIYYIGFLRPNQLRKRKR